jgi:glycosyltransferase involved in cell wall biosynthesis
MTSVDPFRRVFRWGIHGLKRILLTSLAGVRSRGWEPYSRLFLLGDSAPWVLSEEVKSLSITTKRLGIIQEPAFWAEYVRHQSIFYTDHFGLLLREKLPQDNRLATAYFHGLPGTGEPVFDRTYQALCNNHELIDRVQVSHREMLELVLASGIEPAKVHLIPIAVDTSIFRFRTEDTRKRARKRLGIPEPARVVGSFQKDGVGWGDGLEPKLIKGPDVFLDVIRRLKESIPDLFVLLSGPARGYVINGLRSMAVPFTHEYLRDYVEVADLYHALDAYLVTARQEGGPKAVLESMASGVPLITTRVGQAADLVRHGVNGWIVDVADIDGLAAWCKYALNHGSDLESLLQAARQTALANSPEAQLPLWVAFFRGFVHTTMNASEAQGVLS